ncbi:MAG: hypothetical protein HY652_10820 [Acidobacteria bacterium]|nr:hypothetical protein [Acidobacteriota bacterium]
MPGSLATPGFIAAAAERERWRGRFAQARVIAKGKRIRDVGDLVARFGGRSSKWVKKSSPPFEIAGEHFEYPWYEHPGIGKVELKRKRVKQR